MTKNIWYGLVALLLVVACGVLEVVFISRAYNRLADDCALVQQQCERQTLTTQEYDDFRQKWVKLREQSELFLPHVDTYEINLRFAEGQAYVEQGDYAQLSAQLAVIAELLNYVPHLMSPKLRHVV